MPHNKWDKWESSFLSWNSLPTTFSTLLRGHHCYQSLDSSRLSLMRVHVHAHTHTHTPTYYFNLYIPTLYVAHNLLFESIPYRTYGFTFFFLIVT